MSSSSRSGETRARANVEIQLAFDSFLKECCNPAGISKVECEYRFCQLYKHREIVFPREVDVYHYFPSLSRSKLCRDRKLKKEQGTQALRGNYGNRKGKTIIDQNPEMQSVILEMINKTAVQIHQEMVRIYGEKSPSLPTITRWVRSRKYNQIK